MKKKYDLEKEWPKIKEQLLNYSKEAVKIAKRGEQEIIRLSQEGRVRFDAASLNLKQEQLYYLIGKEYVKNKCSSTKSAKLKKLIEELNKATKEQEALVRKIKKSKKR